VGLAARNLVRNVRRTLITGVVVVAGVAFLIQGMGVVDGLDENAIRAQIDTLGGHVTLTPPDYPTEGFTSPVEDLEPVPRELETRLAEHTWAPRLRFDVRLIRGPDSALVRGVGFDPVRDTAVFPRDDLALEGTFPEAGEQAVVLGSKLARLVGAGVGDSLTIQVRTAQGAQNALGFRVAGLMTTHNGLLDNFTVLMPMDRALDLVRAEGPSHLSLRLESREDAPSVAAALADPWTATTYLEEAEDILAINRIRRNAMSLMVFVVLLVAGIGIANTIIMSVYERVKEIGTLAALGMEPRAIGLLFLAEGAILGVVASVVGAAIGGTVTYRLSVAGIDVGAFPEAGTEVAFSSILYTRLDPSMLVVAVIFGIVTATLASVFPALHAVRLNPADAVRAD